MNENDCLRTTVDYMFPGAVDKGEPVRYSADQERQIENSGIRVVESAQGLPMRTVKPTVPITRCLNSMNADLCCRFFGYLDKDGAYHLVGRCALRESPPAEQQPPQV